MSVLRLVEQNISFLYILIYFFLNGKESIGELRIALEGYLSYDLPDFKTIVIPFAKSSLEHISME